LLCLSFTRRLAAGRGGVSLAEYDWCFLTAVTSGRKDLPMRAWRTAQLVTAAAAAVACVTAAGPAVAAAARPSHHAPGFRVRVVLDGAKLTHTFTPSGSATRKAEPLSSPDDITMLGGHLFAGFQNGVGPQGEPSADGNTDSTVVEFSTGGRVLGKWDIKGKCDGLTADPRAHFVIATVNEDANSSLYTIRPGGLPGTRVRHYAYSKPLPHFGGTDAISIYQGAVLISASAPGTTGKAAPQPGYPAVYVARFHPARHQVSMQPLFYDEATARVANAGRSLGKRVRLALVDPDSNEVVPAAAPRFRGDFMLTSQGDQEQIFVSPGRARLALWVLHLSRSVDDTAWVRTRSGRLFGSNTAGGTVDVVTGPFRRGEIFAAVTPCDQNDAPATCPGPGFPANYLGSLNPWTGHLSRVPLRGPAFGPQGMIFVPAG
jgi:hypothetical protein